NKTFYFLSFEKQRYKIGLSGKATEPSTAWVSDAFALLKAHAVPLSNASCHFLGPLTNIPAIPAASQCTNPGLWPTSGPGSVAALPNTPSNFFTPVASIGYSYNGVGKIDHNFSDKHHFFFRYFGGQGNQIAPLGGSPALGTASSNLAYYFES